MHTITWTWKQLSDSSCFGSRGVCGPLISFLRLGVSSGTHSGPAIASASAHCHWSCWWLWPVWQLVFGWVASSLLWLCHPGFALSCINWSDSVFLLLLNWCLLVVRGRGVYENAWGNTVHERGVYCTCWNSWTVGWIRSWQLGICGRPWERGSSRWHCSTSWASKGQADCWGLQAATSGAGAAFGCDWPSPSFGLQRSSWTWWFFFPRFGRSLLRSWAPQHSGLGWPQDCPSREGWNQCCAKSFWWKSCYGRFG